MSFLDDVISTTRSAAQTAGKKTDEAVKLAKLKLKASQTSGDIKEHFGKLGEMVYDMKKNEKSDSEQFDTEIEILDGLYEQLSEINSTIDELRQEVSCPDCGAKTSIENAFCPKCGAKLPEKPVHEEAVSEEVPADEAAPAEAAEDKSEENSSLNEDK